MTLPFRDLLPITAAVNNDGHLELGGRDVVALIEEFGSPLYVFDEETIRAACREYVGTFKEEYQDSHISYSSKAFSSPALLRILEEEGLGIDVVSGGELAIAEAAGFPAERINFHGNNKSRQELEEALDYCIGRVTIDSTGEIALLDSVAAGRGITQAVWLRVSPSIDPHTHMLTTTGVLDSKFGFPIETGQAEEAVRQAVAAPNLDVAGLHFHLGSPIYEVEPYSAAVRYVLSFAARMRDQGLELREFSPGGGYAIGYQPDEPAPGVGAYSREIAAAVREGCDAHGLAEPRLTIEPGRSIVGRAGVAVYTVGALKAIPGVRTYVSVDGGMGDNIRPALYGARYSVLSANRPLDEATEIVTVAGKYCESGDVLARDAAIPPPEPGDLLAIPASGAYCIPMASNYNLSTRPAIIMVGGGRARLIRRRETYDDLLATTIS